jgi:hypothetical protein
LFFLGSSGEQLTQRLSEMNIGRQWHVSRQTDSNGPSRLLSLRGETKGLAPHFGVVVIVPSILHDASSGMPVDSFENVRDLVNRQRPQQEIIEDAEDRSIDAYAEAERKHGYGGECRAAPQ